MKKLESRTLQELLDLAREWGLSGYSKLKKNELVKLLARRLTKKPAETTSTGGGKGAPKEAAKKAPPAKAKPVAAEEEPARDAGKARERKASPAKPARRGAEALPESYSDGRMVLLTRDPQWLYCFWDLTAEQDKRLLAGGEAALRLLERSGREGREIQRIALPRGARSWYLHVEAAGKDYVCQLGLGRKDGGFDVLLTSNPSSTPPAGMGPVEPERFISPPPAPPRAPARAPAAASKAVPAGTAPAERFLVASGAVGQVGGPASAESLSSLRVRLEGRLASELLSSAVHAAGSPRRKPAEADYWLWADAEVIVYGGTVPGSRVTLGGEPIELDAGGRFIARFAFPDGHLPFPIEGVSPDRRFSRKLRIDVRRETAWIKAKG